MNNVNLQEAMAAMAAGKKVVHKDYPGVYYAKFEDCIYVYRKTGNENVGLCSPYDGIIGRAYEDLFSVYEMPLAFKDIPVGSFYSSDKPGSPNMRVFYKKSNTTSIWGEEMKFGICDNLDISVGSGSRYYICGPKGEAI